MTTTTLKAKFIVSHNGKKSAPGEPIRNLTEEEAQRLIDVGAAERLDLDIIDITDDVDVTVEEFAGLGAPDQKKYLELRGMEPAGKAEDRVKQYEDWLNSDV
ncbi:hypothetical protein [Paenibacillus agilis]|uniref:Uncharacterized protein n=1 Tax=Paenibacillus agilis TaxID=3020863 RepID=A0A559IZJ5_9BACL|nr:hypothetical protein [Paenibacillus agilis]TVX93042.1 hypothetical protein FPZ44_08205 [Paenibacillus agilis]